MRLSVVGLGEVGLLFAAMFAEAPQIDLIGVDKAPGKRGIIEAGKRTVGRGYAVPRFPIYDQVQPANVHVVCVDTPLDATSMKADLSNMLDACAAIGRVLRCGDMVIVRSTVPVYTTNDQIGRVIERESRLGSGDYDLVCAPERSSSGGSLQASKDLYHLVGGRTIAAAQRAARLFSEAGLHTIITETIEAAELAKLATNATRDVYQAMANLFAAVCSDLNIDANVLVEAMNRGYPRDRINYPSPGIGGSCLTKDPFFLSEAIKKSEHPNLLIAARRTNDSACDELLRSIEAYASKSRRTAKDLRALVWGVAFKGDPETWDTRNSVSVRIAQELVEMGFTVCAYDPVVDEKEIRGLGLEPATDPATGKWDIVLLFSNHRSLRDEETLNPTLANIDWNGYLYDPHGFVDRERYLAEGSRTYRGITKQWER